MSSLQSEILARKKQSIIRLTALCRYELIKYLVYDIATSFNVLCVLLFFCCFNLNFCSASICFLCLELDLYSSFFNSCCNFKACCDFVPIPLFCNCFFTSLRTLLGFFLSFFTIVSTAGLNCKS